MGTGLSEGLHLEAFSGGGGRREAGCIWAVVGREQETPSYTVSELWSSELIEWAGRKLCMSSP